MALGLTGGLVWGVVGLVGLLDLSMDGGQAQATTAAAEPSTSPASEDRTTRAQRRAARMARQIAQADDVLTRRQATTRLAEPTGLCADSDVVVTPSVPDGHAGAPVKVVLELSTMQAEACSWRVDPERIFVTITQGTTLLWSSQHCPGSLPTTAATPRQDRPDRVRFRWSGKESQPGCTVATDWVWPGTYTVTAVARGSVRAVEASFALGEPEAAAPARRVSSDEQAVLDSARSERRQQRQEAQARREAHREARRQAEREQAREDALRQARQEHREERREKRLERREKAEKAEKADQDR